MSESGNNRKGFYGWLSNTLERRSSWVIVGTIAITILLLLPLSMMAPTESASDNPSGSKVVKLQDKIDDTFSSEVYFMGFLAEARDGDMLTQENLYALYQNEEALRASALSPFLYSRYVETAGTTVEGVDSWADSVNKVLILQSGGAVDLSKATDLQVKLAVDYLLNDPITEELGDWLSIKAYRGEDGWTSPAIIFLVMADDELVKEEYPASIGQDYSEIIALEHFGRDVQEILRGEELNYQAWGIAIDMNLEVADEGRISMIMTVVAMLLIALLLLIIFRSWLITLVTTAGLGMLIIWLKGFSNLIGLKSSMILDLIVPIAIIVLGVDYAIQAVFRYREVRDKGKPPRQALGESTYGVGRALVLAMLTTVVAFAANASSALESVIGFAITASFAIFASLIILGLFVPAVVMRYHAWRSRGTAVFAAREEGRSRGAWLGSLVSGVSSRWFVALPLILIVTGFAAWGWLNVETRMDAEDALDSQSDFVVSLDKMDEHLAQKGGETAFIYVEGDLTRREALDAMKATIDEMDDDEHVGRGLDGKPNPGAFLFDLLEAVVETDYAREQIKTASGVEITDDDDDLIPDTPEQLQAVYDYVIVNGLPQDENTLLYTPKHVEEAFIHQSSGVEKQATLMWIGIPGTREQEVVKASAAELNEDMDIAMGDVDSIDFYGLTGTGYIRVDQFDAIADAMSRSLIIAAIAVLALLLVVFRSLRYAIMTIIPVLLVACWLYGFMYVGGYYLNMMTATIAAISIGVGIDFSIHFTERFRQERKRSPDKKTALRQTARTTGFALFSAALTTVVGFAVIAFAPMPMFATFGLLTAVMIALSFLMALFVLPSLLLLFAPGKAQTEEKETASTSR